MMYACALVPLAGLAYEYYAAARDEKEYPPPGKLIEVDGYRLHVNCQGTPKEGVPSVILESGIWGCSMDWQLVQPKIGEMTQVISYDRAGYGWSDSGPAPRTFEQIRKELKGVLEVMGIKPPYIFIGHSLGGPIVRYFHSQHPEEVAGMVLIDTPHEDAPPQFSRIFRVVAGALSYLTCFGIFRGLMETNHIYSDNPKWTPTMQKTYLAAHRVKSKSFATLLNEWDCSLENYKMLQQKRKHLGDKPIIVIPRGNEKLLRPGISREENQRLYEKGLAEQRKLLQESNRSELRIATHSSHLVNLDEPEVIIKAVEDMLALTYRQKF